MAAKGIATIFSPTASKSSMCMTCPNRFSCIAGEGIDVTVLNFEHLISTDNKISWTLYCDLPDCRQLPGLLNGAKILATLNTGNQTPIEGTIVDSQISREVKLHVIGT